jgi:hypothetical protein
VKADANVEWKSSQAALMNQAARRYSLDRKVAEVANAELAAHGWKTVRPELARMVRAGKIDEGTAGLVSKWGQVLEELESRFGVDAKALLAKHLTSKSITSGELSALRGEIRELTATHIVKLRGTKRGEVLNEMLQLQPDEASKGHLFRAYRREAMRGDDTFGVGESMPESFSGKDLKNRRTPDDVLFIHDEVEGQLAPGRYAIEDKAGPNAFKIDQARDYARRAYKPGQ